MDSREKNFIDNWPIHKKMAKDWAPNLRAVGLNNHLTPKLKPKIKFKKFKPNEDIIIKPFPNNFNLALPH